MYFSNDAHICYFNMSYYEKEKYTKMYKDFIGKNTNDTNWWIK